MSKYISDEYTRLTEELKIQWGIINTTRRGSSVNIKAQAKRKEILQLMSKELHRVRNSDKEQGGRTL